MSAWKPLNPAPRPRRASPRSWSTPSTPNAWRSSGPRCWARAVSSRFEQFVWLQPAGPGAPQLAFQQVEQPTEGRRRLHLDIHGPDPTALRARAESLGAGFVEGNDIGDFHWDVMQDPEGNEFCIAGD